ncbi:MAG: hypothetical protein AUJ81_03005 [Helicobacteraceae bacterium CG1_02_36_14]|nr:MAG: hypothetical protein AUJ81_03005 [Helicobacteraceae bacterium CG1_02_36_14]
MIVNRNHHVFKGHKTLLGSKYVTYGEVELPTRYELFSKSKDGFDWGSNGSGALQLSFSILCQLSTVEFAKEHAINFNTEVVKGLNNRDWILNSVDVLKWIDNHSEKIEIVQQHAEEENKIHDQNKIINAQNKITTAQKKVKPKKSNIVKNICKELGITQKSLAEILEVPEGTVSSWAVKNELPRLGKKAIEFYILSKKNQDIVDSYKNFTKLLATQA